MHRYDLVTFGQREEHVVAAIALGVRHASSSLAQVSYPSSDDGDRLVELDRGHGLNRGQNH